MLRKIVSGLSALALAGVANAEVKEYNWDVTWSWGAPDGVGRPLVGINNQWPLPTIRVQKDDIVRVHLTNKLGNQTTGIHWHGINQISTAWMDGPSMVTQCPIPPNMTFTYTFPADVAGTFWYHSHNMGQYPDGMRGLLIVDDPNDPWKDQYDEEHVISVSDWYHEQSIPLVQTMLSSNNPNGLPPFPNGALINDGQGSDMVFDPAKTYRLRFVSFAAFASFMITSPEHPFTVIMNDASYLNGPVVNQLRLTAGQRYDVLVKGSDAGSGNFPILFSLDQNRDWTNTGAALAWPFNLTAWFVSDPAGDRPVHTVDSWLPEDDALWAPLVEQGPYEGPDKTFEMEFTTCLDDRGIPRQCLNGAPYVEQKVPTLYTAATVGEANTDPIVYGPVHPFIANFDDTVDIVINNLEPAAHPFHLHGHHFQVLTRPASNAGTFPGYGAAEFSSNPPTRDTVTIMANSYAVLRFKADNPGVFLFHCHIEWHVEMGLTATIIEAPEMLRNLPIPEDHIKACKALGIKYRGNAGGNVDDPFDTSNFNTSPPDTYIGATYVPPPSTCPAKRRRAIPHAEE
jgi:iron transport multicopper oxidase